MKLVIDNGSGIFRAGWATDAAPSVVVDPHVAKSRDKVTGEPVVQVGGHHSHKAKTPFDDGIPIQADLMESLLDYALLQAGATPDTLGQVVMTEPVCTPPLSRALINELFFEAYNVPEVALGVDALFSMHANGLETGLVVSISHSASHIIPVPDTKPLFSLSKRLPIGTSRLVRHMRHLMQLKYPDFPHILGSREYNNFVATHCYVAQCYPQEALRVLYSASDDVLVPFSVTRNIAQPAMIDRVVLTAEEHSKLIKDRASWIADLVRERDTILATTKLAEATGAIPTTTVGTSARNKSETASRMRAMASLLEDEDAVSSGGKRKKRRTTQEGRFGDDVGDWKMYSALSKDSNTADDNDPNAARLARIDRILVEYDPYGQFRSLHASRTLHRLMYGSAAAFTDASADAAEQAVRAHTICLAIERARVPEALFAPAMVGVDCAGLSELAATIVSLARDDRLYTSIFCTGGGANLLGLPERLTSSLTPEFGESIAVKVAQDPIFDAWRGAAIAPVQYTTREEYFERGETTLSTHPWSNPR